jgi:hypothetical protein
MKERREKAELTSDDSFGGHDCGVSEGRVLTGRPQIEFGDSGAWAKGKLPDTELLYFLWDRIGDNKQGAWRRCQTWLTVTPKACRDK